MSATEASTGGVADPAAGASAGGGATTGFRIARQANPSEGDGIVRVDVVKFPCTIGRSPDADIRFDHPSVSLRHAELRMGPDGPVLVDTGRQGDGSTNGTFLGNQGRDKLTPGVEKRWPVGVPARVGQRWLRLERQAPAGAGAGAGAGAPGRAAVGGAVATVAGGVAAGVVGGGTPAGAGHVTAGVSRAAGVATGAAAGAAGGMAAGGAQEGKAEKGGITITRVPALQLEVGGRADGAVVVSNSAAFAQFVRLNVVLPESLRGCLVRVNQGQVRIEAGETKSIGFLIQAPATGASNSVPPAGEHRDVRVQIRDTQRDLLLAESELSISVRPFGQPTARLDPPEVSAGEPFEVIVTNGSNVTQDARLSPSSIRNDISFIPNVAVVQGIEPGEEKSLRFDAQPSNRQLVGEERTLPFKVKVEYLKGLDHVDTLEGKLHSKARVARAWTFPLVGLAAAAALVMYGFGYFRAGEEEPTTPTPIPGTSEPAVQPQGSQSTMTSTPGVTPTADGKERETGDSSPPTLYGLVFGSGAAPTPLRLSAREGTRTPLPQPTTPSDAMFALFPRECSEGASVSITVKPTKVVQGRTAEVSWAAKNTKAGVSINILNDPLDPIGSNLPTTGSLEWDSEDTPIGTVVSFEITATALCDNETVSGQTVITIVAPTPTPSPIPPTTTLTPTSTAIPTTAPPPTPTETPTVITITGHVRDKDSKKVGKATVTAWCSNAEYLTREVESNGTTGAYQVMVPLTLPCSTVRLTAEKSPDFPEISPPIEKSRPDNVYELKDVLLNFP